MEQLLREMEEKVFCPCPLLLIVVGWLRSLGGTKGDTEIAIPRWQLAGGLQEHGAFLV